MAIVKLGPCELQQPVPTPEIYLAYAQLPSIMVRTDGARLPSVSAFVVTDISNPWITHAEIRRLRKDIEDFLKNGPS